MVLTITEIVHKGEKNMVNYFINNDLIRGAYILRYDESRDSGYVEKVESCVVPNVQTIPFIKDLGLDQIYMFQAIVAKWYKDKISCEFSKKEFVEYADKFSFPAIPVNDQHIVECKLGFTNNAAFMRIAFDRGISEPLTEIFKDSHKENNIIDIAFPYWDTAFSDFPMVTMQTDIGVYGGDAIVSDIANTATYNLMKL